MRRAPCLPDRDDDLGHSRRRAADEVAVTPRARALFAEGGYEGTTTRAIARRTRIAAGTLFTYFPEKRTLLLHLFRQRIDMAIEEGFADAARAKTRSRQKTNARHRRALFAARAHDEYVDAMRFARFAADGSRAAKDRAGEIIFHTCDFGCVRLDKEPLCRAQKRPCQSWNGLDPMHGRARRLRRPWR